MISTATAGIREKLIAMQESLRPLLNLGCGPDTIEGADNIDLYAAYPGVIEMDSRKLDFPDGKYALVVAHQLLEHLPLKEGKAALSEWRRVTKYGGRIVVSVPFIDAMVELIRSAGDPGIMYAVNTWIFGCPEKGPGMEHKAIYSTDLLINCLQDAGWNVLEIHENFPVRFTPSVTIIAEAV